MRNVYETSIHSEIRIVNPFPGLRSFQANESHLFFGRETHIGDVLKKLDSVHFVAIVGTSGTGKSSLIRAGVLPAFSKQNKESGRKIWHVVAMTPGSDPIGNLARAITSSDLCEKVENPNAYCQRLEMLMRDNPLGLVQAMRPEIASGEKLLILADQFEEVFRFEKESEQSRKAEYDAFVQLIIETVRQRDVPVYVILTLRSDFLGDCVSFEGLPEAINDGHYLVPRMNMNEVRRAITGPVELAGGKISPRLIQYIHQHLGNNSDQLPILQHALMRGWDYWTKHAVAGEPLDLIHFESIGGLENALSSHADEAFNELSPEGQLLCEKIFKCLTTREADNRGVRRPLPLSKLSAITGESRDAILECLKPFREEGRSFILPGSDVSVNDETIFDISHESLMRGWKRLRDWVEEEMESAEMFLRICRASELHLKGAQALWRNPELQLALDWEVKQKPDVEWASLYHSDFSGAMEFLHQSQQADLREKRRIKSRNILIRSFVAFFLVVVTALAGWALMQTERANENNLRAQEKSKEAIEQKALAVKEREKAENASSQAYIAKELAEQQALFADSQKQIATQEKARAESAALRALLQQQQALEQKGIADRKSIEALTQKLKADSAREEALRMRMISAGANLAYEAGQITENPELSALLAIQSFNIAKKYGGDVYDATLYQSAGKAINSLLPAKSSIVLNNLKESSDMQCGMDKVLFPCKDGVCRSYSLINFKLIAEEKTEINPQTINTAYTSYDGIKWLYGLNSNEIAVNKNLVFTGHEGLVRAVCFLPANGSFITGGRDNKLIYWKDYKFVHAQDLAAKIRSITKIASGNTIFAGCENGMVYKYNFDKNSLELFSTRENSRAESVAQSSDGKLVAVGYSDGVTRVYNQNGKLIRELAGTGIINDVILNLSEGILVTSSTARQINIYRLDNLTSLPVNIKTESQIKGISIYSAGQTLMVYAADGTLSSFPLKNEQIISQLSKLVKRQLTEDEWNTFVGSDIPFEKAGYQKSKK
ncbi:MAG: hypothetical protein R2850_12475 [Bacteroidia bacterium]